ncbi:hypothetical protein MLD38_035254 [Melastoma candidum]|uniref:Uncharacterized protein n=1 Tax=Melastoma candidum TaxID=119954 RepID=A0ACB9MFP2_9MYRT|nr:hypothetical protein MLD38_035254 [Melastoma candidum]
MLRESFSLAWRRPFSDENQGDFPTEGGGGKASVSSTASQMVGSDAARGSCEDPKWDLSKLGTAWLAQGAPPVRCLGCEVGSRSWWFVEPVLESAATGGWWRRGCPGLPSSGLLCEDGAGRPVSELARRP